MNLISYTPGAPLNFTSFELVQEIRAIHGDYECLCDIHQEQDEALLAKLAGVESLDQHTALALIQREYEGEQYVQIVEKTSDQYRRAVAAEGQEFSLPEFAFAGFQWKVLGCTDQGSTIRSLTW